MQVIGLWKKARFLRDGRWKSNDVHDISPLAEIVYEKVKNTYISFSSKEAFLGGNLLVEIFDKGINISIMRKHEKLRVQSGHLSTCYVEEVEVSRGELKNRT